MRLTDAQAAALRRLVESIEHGEVIVSVLGPGRPIRARVTRSVDLTDSPQRVLDATNKAV